MSYLKPIYEVCARLRDQGSRHSNIAIDDLDFLCLLLKNAHISNSQIFQDLWVLFELQYKRDGYFVEFGACDGVRLSNTLILEKLFGWNGIVSEPCRSWHEHLYVNRSCYVTTKAVFSRTGETVEFNEPALREHATINAYSDSDAHGSTRENGNIYQVETISLQDLLETACAPCKIDYLSIDTEGSEFDILNAFDFSRYDIKLISVEHNFTSRRQDLFDMLTSKGYRRKFYKMSQFDDWYSKI